MSSKIDFSVDKENAENKDNYKNLNKAIGLHLPSLMYETDRDVGKFVKENCPSGTEMLKFISYLMDADNMLDNLKYCVLDDASSIKIYFDLIKDRLNDSKTNIDVTTIDNIAKLELDLPTYKLLEKNYTFYESFGYIPTGLNIERLELSSNTSTQNGDEKDFYLWVNTVNDSFFDQYAPEFSLYDIFNETEYTEHKKRGRRNY